MIDLDNKDLSEIKETDSYLIFPSYYVEDYFYDLVINVDNVDVVTEGQKSKIRKTDVITWNALHDIRQKCYRATEWYDSISELTPLSFFIKASRDELKKIVYPKFIRGNSASPKDLITSSIFENFETASFALFNSERCKHDDVFMIREIDDDILNQNGYEFRCFYYRSFLSAVSCYGLNAQRVQYEQRIIDFFKMHSYKFIYTDCVVDIFINDSKILIIEFNCFGADSNTDASLYDWRDDYFILHNTHKTDFRYRTE
jgi:hypothetical protein